MVFYCNKQLSHLLMKSGDYESALHHLNIAIKVDSKDEQLNEELLKILTGEGFCKKKLPKI